MATLKIHLLGTPQIWLDDTLVTFPSRKATAVLAYLAVTGQAQTRAHLAALFWPDSDQARARGALRYTLSLIRKQLGESWLHINRRQIFFAPDAAITSDYAQFQQNLEGCLNVQIEAALDETCIEQLETAVSLYRGDFLAGFGLRDSIAFDEWVFYQSDSLRQSYATALQQLIHHHQVQGTITEAIAFARRWLQQNPLNESAHFVLMQLFDKSQQWAAVERQYEVCAAILDKELGVKPSPAIETLARTARHRRLELPLSPQVSEPSPPITDLTFNRRDQLILLQKVRHFWIDGVLQATTASLPHLSLHFEPIPELIDHPWKAVVGTAVYRPHTQTDILELFDEADRALLILGEPGSGKTITLITLAQQLIAQAENDATRPIPVILNLSNWGEQKQALNDWIVTELVAKYQIPREMGEKWLNGRQLTLLLDGLDEVPQAGRGACIAAINEFRRTHGLVETAVSCRRTDYELVQPQLVMNGAILIQPLSLSQITTSNHNHLLTKLQNNPILADLIQTPLLLNLMNQAIDQNSLFASTHQDQIHHQLLETYIRHILKNQTKTPSLPPKQITNRLTWLAQQMTQHNQTIFLIEQIQPSWFPTPRWRWVYMLFSRTFGGLLSGILTWLFYQIALQNIPQFSPQILLWIHQTFQIPRVANDLIIIFLLNSFLGLLIGLIDGALFTQRERLHKNAIDPKRGKLHLAIVCTIACLMTTLVISFFDHFFLALLTGILQAVAFGLGFGYVTRGQSFSTEVQTVEAMSWSWTGAFKGLLPGFAIGAVAAFISTGLYGNYVARMNLFGAAEIGFLFGGWGHNRLESSNRANQGIWLSLRNSLFGGVLIGSITFITFSLYAGRILYLEGIMLGYAALILYGMGDVMRHTIIRAILWKTNDVPWACAKFLDEVSRHALLRKVGGGYIFMHRLLLQYFAGKKD